MSSEGNAPLPPETLQGWVDDLKATLDLEDDIQIAEILDLAKDFAHNVARPAAPLTTFAIGLAVGRAAAGGSDPASEFTRLSEAARARSFEWKPE